MSQEHAHQDNAPQFVPVNLEAFSGFQVNLIRVGLAMLQDKVQTEYHNEKLENPKFAPLVTLDVIEQTIADINTVFIVNGK